MQRNALRIKTIVPCNGCRRGNQCCTLDLDTPTAFLSSASATVCGNRNASSNNTSMWRNALMMTCHF
jgi:hypothetical protein